MLSNSTACINGRITQYRKTVPIQDQYEYQKTLQFQENSISKDFKLFTTIMITLLYVQAGLIKWERI